MIDKLVDALETASTELLASGHKPTIQQQKKLKTASKNLQDFVDRADRISAACLVVHDDGSVTTEYEPVAEPVLEVTAEGLELTAGERLSTVLKRKRAEKGMTQAEVAANMPISEDTYRRIENGWDYELPDDILESLASHLGMAKEEVVRMYTLDKTSPVVSSGSVPARY